MCTIASVNEVLGLSKKVIPYGVAQNAVYKDSCRTIIGDLMPQGTSAKDPREAAKAARSIGYPLIVKPGDGGGTKGVTLLSKAEKSAFDEAFDYAKCFSRSKVVVIEEFHDGQVLGAESLVLDGQVHLLAIADKLISPAPRCITLGVAFPSQLSLEVQARIRAINEAAITRLGIRWGPTHIDMVINRRGEPKIIDVGPRLAGGVLMSRLIPAAYDYDIYRAVIQLAVGEMPEPLKEPNGLHYASRFLTTARKGTLHSVSYREEDLDTCNIAPPVQLIPNGTFLGNPENDGARLLMFSTHGTSHKQIMAQLDRFSESVQIIVE
jgi:biotin carboxylase